jgi:hypothetical protein
MTLHNVMTLNTFYDIFILKSYEFTLCLIKYIILLLMFITLVASGFCRQWVFTLLSMKALEVSYSRAEGSNSYITTKIKISTVSKKQNVLVNHS